MKTVLMSIALGLITIFLWYSVFAFINWDWNFPSEGREVRLHYIVSQIIITILVVNEWLRRTKRLDFFEEFIEEKESKK